MSSGDREISYEDHLQNMLMPIQDKKQKCLDN